MNLPSINLFHQSSTYRSSFRKIWLFVSWSIVFLPMASAARADDELDIRATFAGLQQAFLSHDGNQALGLISSDTKDYYRMLSAIASGKANPDKINKANLTPLNLMMVKYVQRTLPKDFFADAIKNNPDKLLKLAVSKGLGSKELTDGIDLGKIELAGQNASAILLKNQKILPVHLGFQKEGGQWKVSLLAMFEQANKMAENFLKKTGLKQEDLQKLILNK